MFCSVVYCSQDNDCFFFPLPLNYPPVGAANNVPNDVISGVVAGLQKVYPHFSVMPDCPVHECEEKLRAHFFAHGDPLSDWTILKVILATAISPVCQRDAQ